MERDSLLREQEIDNRHKDEEYNPEEIVEQFETQLRVTSASIAVQLPWNPTEPVTNTAIQDRFELVYNWLREGVKKDLVLPTE